MPQIVLGAATGILSVLAIEISRSNQRGKIPTKHVIAASVTPYTTEHVLGAPPLFAVSSVRSELRYPNVSLYSLLLVMNSASNATSVTSRDSSMNVIMASTAFCNASFSSGVHLRPQP
jgi:hypothetical protein